MMSAFMSRFWWVLVLRGLAAILLGIFAFTWPHETIAALVLAFGAVALVDGALAMGMAIAGRKLTPNWWILLLQGLVGIGIGVLTLVQPAITAVALLICIAAWAMGMGVLQVIVAVKLRNAISGEWWLALGGIAGVVFGILVMRHPAAGALAVLALIGGYALVAGVMLMIGGFDIRRLSKHAEA
jgi:uncharacterized membrane protein HdeD (DUF308 family)